MSVTLLQGLILALIVFAFAWDARWECFFVFHPIIVCFVTGLVLGDWKLGLEAGAIAELSYLGLTTVGRIAYAVDRYRVSVIVLRI